MRALPIGLYSEVKDVIEFSRLNSDISHAHPEAIDSSIATSLVAYGLYYKKYKPSDIIKFISKSTITVTTRSPSPCWFCITRGRSIS